MEPRDFCYWLNGFIELNKTDEPPTDNQWKIIKEHLALVMTKQTSLKMNPTLDNSGTGSLPIAPTKTIC